MVFGLEVIVQAPRGKSVENEKVNHRTKKLLNFRKK